MALLLLLLHTSLSLSPGTAQLRTADTPQPPPIDFSRSAGILLGVFLTTFFFLIIFIYIRCCVHQDNNTPVPDRLSPLPRRGLEDSAIEALPTVVYSDVKDHKIGRDVLECAVCLCEFEDHETLKLLPKCDHVFHSDCIATWLSAHVTCPVCRFDLSAGDVVFVEPEVGLTSAPVDLELGWTETPTRTPPVVDSSPRMRSPIDFERLRSMSLLSIRGWRSRSARPGRYWTEEERGRFTLRLPESVRRELLAGRMRRSASVAVVFAREGSEGRGEWSPRAELSEVFLEEEERERVRYPMSESLERELRRSRSASLAIGSQRGLKWKRRWFRLGDKDGEGTSRGTTFDYCICPGGVFC